MPDESEPTIKSGADIVGDFVEGLFNRAELDADTVSSIGALHRSARLTRTNLLRALEEKRSAQLKQPPEQSS